MPLSFSFIIAVLIGLVGITIMIIVHELGHFAAAKAFGITVESLSFGFGPVIKKWTKNGTEFKICLIPFGGSCKMAGRDDVEFALFSNAKSIEKCEEGSIYSVSPIKRIITYACGPLANILFAFICYAVLLMLDVLVSFIPAKISLTSSSCAAYQYGLRSGDIVLSVNGIQVNEYSELEKILQSSDEAVTFETDRGFFEVTPIEGKFGILPYEKQYRREPGLPVGKAVIVSFRECFREMTNFIYALANMLSGKDKVSETISGTVGASAGIGLAAEKGFAAGFDAGIRIMLYILASVSISMGFANLIPITALDGGLILTGLAELICGHTLNPKVYIILQISGLIFIFCVIPVLIIFF